MATKNDLDALRRAYGAIVDEARREVATGREPDARSFEVRVRAVGEASEGGARVDRAEREALQQLERVLSVHRARALVARQSEPTRPAAAPRPPRGLLRSRPTISGNMDVRRGGTDDEPTLAWDPAPAVTSWEVRVSERPDPRGEYVVRNTLTLPAATTSVDVPLGDAPLRVHLLGRGRDGRLLRRALISALTRETWNDRWQRRASAS